MMTLWTNWIAGAGALALALFFPRLLHMLSIPRTWLPLPIFIVAYLLAVYERHLRYKRGNGCTPVLHVAGLTLFWSALIMVTIDVLNSKMLLDNLINWSNSNRTIPFITCLVMFPVLTCVSLWVMMRGYEQNSSENYRARGGILPGNGAIATLLSIESRYQVRALFVVSIALNLVEWWYYLAYYFNTNFNSPDIFFFNWMPIALFGISLVFMAGRYRSMAYMIGPIAMASRESGTMVRFLLISGDRILLAPNAFGRWDTPAITSIGRLDVGNQGAIKSAFERIAGTDRFTLRHLYDTNITDDIEVLHYAAFLPDDASVGAWPEAEWKTLPEIDQLIHSAAMAAEFNDEIFRIYTITMAWKTYDAEGRRIYPIKNYRPAFRLREMPGWDVDYTDTRWLDVANNNQDKPFYHIRRLWRRITSL